MTAPPAPPPPASTRSRVPGPWCWAFVVALLAGLGTFVLLTESGTEMTAGPTTTTTSVPPTTTAAAGTTTTKATTTTTTTTTTTSTTTTTLPGKPPHLPEEPAYHSREIAYFSEIAGRPEFGDTGGVLHRWEIDLLVEVHGAPSGEDLAALNALLSELNTILEPIEIRLVDEGGTVDLHYAPEAEFPAIEPNYQPGNSGYVYVWWNGRGEIVRARVLISTGVAPRFRHHLLREELTQALGLLNDSWEYEDSIFYQGWTGTQAYAPIDVKVIEMLYRPEVRSGMEIDEAVAILGGLSGD